MSEKSGAIPVVIDGPNFVNRVMDLEVDHDVIAQQLSLTQLRRALNAAIRTQELATDACDGPIDFVCSKKLFGPKTNQFTPDERETMLARFMGEVGVHVEVIDLPGDKEKGVDGAVQAQLDSFAKENKYVALIAADRDYVPALRKLRSQGCRILVASLQTDFPKEIANEAWGVVELLPHFNSLFTYSYPHYPIETLTMGQIKALIANADDRTHNQIRVRENGSVYISPHPAVGNQKLESVRLAFESFEAGNHYVGPQAASHGAYVASEFSSITNAWKRKLRGYIDYQVPPPPGYRSGMAKEGTGRFVVSLNGDDDEAFETLEEARLIAEIRAGKLGHEVEVVEYGDDGQAVQVEEFSPFEGAWSKSQNLTRAPHIR
jgi:hypothetical protein